MSSSAVHIPLSHGEVLAGTSAADAPRANFRLGYRPSLDGMRGIAISGVLAVHTSHIFGLSLLRGGSLGVDVFFVLSGFLITSLLLEEWEQTATISLGKFYLRRFLRLTPALLMMLAAVSLAAPLLYAPREAAQTLRALPLALLYLSDLAIAFGDNVQLGALKHTWSLAVEEQFYLVWPPALCLMLRSGLPRRKTVSYLSLMVLLVVLYRCALWQGHATISRAYYSFDTRADALLVGCIAGMLMSWNLVPEGRRARYVLRMLSVFSAFLITLMMLVTDHATHLMYLGGFTLVSVATAIIIIRWLHEPPDALARRLLENGLLVWTGRLSYGLYLWHYPLFKAVRYWNAHWLSQLALALALTFACASLSFYLIERPALRLKKRFA